MNKQEILDALKESGYEKDDTTLIGWDELDMIFYSITQEDEKNLSLQIRSTIEGDTWVQSEWYSPTLQMTIITNPDVNVGETIESVVDTYLGLLDDAEKLENTLKERN